MSSRPSWVPPPLRTKKTEQAPVGTYTSLDVTDLLEQMPDVALALRPVYDVSSGHRPEGPTKPEVAAMGPLTASSSHALTVRTDYPIWDVNGYYRVLGIPAPYRVSKRDLMRAYVAIDGQGNDFATWAFKRLIDPEYREFYNERPLGKPVDDIFRWLELQRRGAQWAAKETLRTGKVHTYEDFIPEDILDKLKQSTQDERPEQKVTFEPSTNTSWAFGYYLWDTRFRDDMALSQWQLILAKTFWREGLSVPFAVGYFERASNAAAVRYRLSYPDAEAILIRSGLVPTQEMADVVVATYHNEDVAVPLGDPLFIAEPLNFENP